MSGKKPPEVRTIRQERYRLVLLEIRERDELGRPTVCCIRYDEEVMDFSDEKQSRHFLTAFAHAKSLEPKVGGRA